MSDDWLSNPWFYLIILAIISIIIYAYVSWKDDVEKKVEREKIEERLRQIEAELKENKSEKEID